MSLATLPWAIMQLLCGAKRQVFEEERKTEQELQALVDNLEVEVQLAGSRESLHLHEAHEELEWAQHVQAPTFAEDCEKDLQAEKAEVVSEVESERILSAALGPVLTACWGEARLLSAALQPRRPLLLLEVWWHGASHDAPAPSSAGPGPGPGPARFLGEQWLACDRAYGATLQGSCSFGVDESVDLYLAPRLSLGRDALGKTPWLPPLGLPPESPAPSPAPWRLRARLLPTPVHAKSIPPGRAEEGRRFEITLVSLLEDGGSGCDHNVPEEAWVVIEAWRWGGGAYQAPAASTSARSSSRSPPSGPASPPARVSSPRSSPRSGEWTKLCESWAQLGASLPAGGGRQAGPFDASFKFEQSGLGRGHARSGGARPHEGEAVSEAAAERVAAASKRLAELRGLEAELHEEVAALRAECTEAEEAGLRAVEKVPAAGPGPRPCLASRAPLRRVCARRRWPRAGLRRVLARHLRSGRLGPVVRRGPSLHLRP